VHVRPNRTELLKIIFSDYLGSLKISSEPDAELSINGESHGMSPAMIENLPVGDHSIRLSTRFGPQNDLLDINEDVYVRAKQVTDLNFDFNDYYKLGKIVVESNMQNMPFSVLNTNLNKKYAFRTDLHSELLTGNYKIRWNDHASPKSFIIRESAETHIFLPFTKEIKPRLDMSDLQSFRAEEAYFNLNYRPLDEEYEREVLQWDWRSYNDTRYSTTALYLGLMGMLTGAIMFGLKDPAPVGGGITLGLSTVFACTAFIHKEPKSFPIKSNIDSNRQQRAKIEQEYMELYSGWERELKSKNDAIERENQRRMDYNRDLPPFEVTYQ
jgi:hypothetical protein